MTAESLLASWNDTATRRAIVTFAQDIYGIPPERVIGSALGLGFDDSGDDTQLIYKSKIEFFDDGPEKPVRIWSRIGRRPLVAGATQTVTCP